VRWQNSSSFGCEAVARALGQPNVLECAVGISSVILCLVCLSFSIGYNGWQLPEGGDFEALHCQPSINFDRSTKLELTTEPPLLGSCC